MRADIAYYKEDVVECFPLFESHLFELNPVTSVVQFYEKMGKVSAAYASQNGLYPSNKGGDDSVFFLHAKHGPGTHSY